MRSILDIQNRREDARLKAMNPESPYSGFDLIADISHMIDEVIKREYQSLEKRIFGNELSPSAVFLYGSGGRNEMTNYSDIDIHFISTANDRRTTLFREGLHSALTQYKFGKIDDPYWANMDSLENYA
ncbi:MAG: nucleotidyltransferase domain-containing protein, partial [Nanoarchaeota archaeon]|nr:nucleotidyltransferase domain-containing protein [Nanoarchaeota archaeon]